MVVEEETDQTGKIGLVIEKGKKDRDQGEMPVVRVLLVLQME